jgi:hypothetical protein
MTKRQRPRCQPEKDITIPTTPWGLDGDRRDVGSSGSYSWHRSSTPCYPTGKCTPIHSCYRRGAAGVSGFISSILPTASALRTRLLSNVESRPPDCYSPPTRCASYGAKANPRAIRSLLERPPQILRPRLAGPILFLPVGPPQPVGRAALYRTQSGAGRFGHVSGNILLVGCRRSLRYCPARRVPRYGHVATTLDA